LIIKKNLIHIDIVHKKTGDESDEAEAEDDDDQYIDADDDEDDEDDDQPQVHSCQTH